ncbi:hypothetical protein [Hymenobacter psychrotolerans]|uniref:Uncharacterized protein n=1 Tax=Hymenobacter psychrotolerans DSM 18569 TaxID=1121959 RepID=A0A1M6UHW4_9BACT|nr:hypothetical protein [Hymenobacter psychrotolerans]SHK68743.1 hypothetical protein SAMN02746009_01365 [Hymenobacter psychrotolerans DSM 18569]
MVVYFLLSGIGFLCAFAALPLLTGYCAASYGRSFWLWFALGWLLPIVSFFVLVGLIARVHFDHGERLLAEAKAILAEAESLAVKDNE